MSYKPFLASHRPVAYPEIDLHYNVTSRLCCANTKEADDVVLVHFNPVKSPELSLIWQKTMLVQAYWRS